jgi:hypothetical protein
MATKATKATSFKVGSNAERRVVGGTSRQQKFSMTIGGKAVPVEIVRDLKTLTSRLEGSLRPEYKDFLLKALKNGEVRIPYEIPDYVEDLVKLATSTHDALATLQA